MTRTAAVTLLTLGLLAAACAGASEIQKDDKPGISEMKSVLLTGSIAGREEAARRLTAKMTAESFDALLAGMADDYAAYVVVDTLITALGAPNANKEDIAGLLGKGLSDASSRTRMLTAYVLGETRERSASAGLAKALKDEDRYVRMFAAEALRKAGDKDAVPALVEALKDPFPLTRLHAAAALGNIGDAGAAGPLATALDDPDAKLNAARALGQIGGVAAESYLVAKLADPDKRFVCAVVAGLAHCATSEDTVKRLKKLGDVSRDPMTRHLCRGALQSIGERGVK